MFKNKNKFRNSVRSHETPNSPTYSFTSKLCVSSLCDHFVVKSTKAQMYVVDVRVLNATTCAFSNIKSRQARARRLVVWNGVVFSHFLLIQKAPPLISKQDKKTTSIKILNAPNDRHLNTQKKTEGFGPKIFPHGKRPETVIRFCLRQSPFSCARYIILRV